MSLLPQIGLYHISYIPPYEGEERELYIINLLQDRQMSIILLIVFRRCTNPKSNRLLPFSTNSIEVDIVIY